MPHINRLCLDGHSLQAVLGEYGIPDDGFAADEREQPLAAWLNGTLIGSVEHTRNGYDALLAVQERSGRLAFPAGTIAVSEYKRTTEADEVAGSCILAMQSVLYSAGKTLKDRCCVVIGSRGTIGRHAVRQLCFLLRPGRVLGVDIVVPGAAPLLDDDVRHVHCFDEIPDADLGEIDLVFGICGHSTVTAGRLERLLRLTRHEDLYFASGSTKTAEFTDMIAWSEALLQSDSPRIDGQPVRVERLSMRAPRAVSTRGSSLRSAFSRAGACVVCTCWRI